MDSLAIFEDLLMYRLVSSSLRSWRDSWAGERQSRHIPSLAKPAREFASGEAASEIPACPISNGFCFAAHFYHFWWSN